MTGTRMGSWTLGPEIGRGPTGVVFKATGTESGDPAAVKVVSSDAIRDPQALLRFPGECLGLRRLTHPNIARFYEAGVQAGQAYFVREWVDGVDLATLIRHGHTADTWRELAIPLAVQLAWALNHGHRRSLLHRRITPSNIIVANGGKIKLTDFGISKIVPTAPLALAPEPWGSLAFLPPELFTGKQLTRKSDLYSLGAVVYACATGRPPFSAASAAEYLHKHCYLLPDRPVNIVPKTNIEFDDLICTLLAKDPGRRPVSAPAVVEELDRIRGKLERKGERVPWPVDPGDTSMHTPLSGEMIAKSKREADAESKPLFGRMAVVLPLLALVLAVIVYLLFRPGPSAQEYYDQATKLLATGKPDDADKAWDDYLEPLQRKYPGQFEDEIAKLREKRQIGRELTKAIDQGLKVKFGSDSERLYSRGLALARVGLLDEAQACWDQVVSQADKDDRWTRAAQTALEELAKKRRN